MGTQNIVVRGNRMGRKFYQNCGLYAPFLFDQMPSVFDDNRWEDTGVLIVP